TEDRAGRVRGDRHPAGVHDVHRAVQDRAAELLDPRGRRVDIGHRHVRGPHRWHAPRLHVRRQLHHARYVLAVLPGHDVWALRITGGLLVEVPTKQLSVEPLARGDVGAREI